MVKSKYGPSDLSRFCNIPANIESITPKGIANPRLGSGKIGKVEVNCRFLHEESKWGRLEYKHGTVSAGIIHMEITFRNLHQCALDSAKIRVSLEGEHHILEKYHKIAHKITGLKSMAKPVEVKRLGPVSLAGTPFGVSSRSAFSFKPTVEYAGLSGSAAEATLEREWTKHTRWVFEGSASPGNQSSGTTCNTVEWALHENVPEGQPSHGNCFRTAFVFTNDGQPFIIKVEVEGSLRRIHHRVKETVKRGLKFGGSRKDAATTLIRGFENEKRRLNKLAERVNEDINRVNGAVDYNQRWDGKAHDPEPLAPDEEEDGMDEKVADAKYRNIESEKNEINRTKTSLELAKMMSQYNMVCNHAEAKSNEGKGNEGKSNEGKNAKGRSAESEVKQPVTDKAVESPAKEEGISNGKPKKPATEKVVGSLTKEEEETVALLQILLLLWQEVFARIQKLLALN